MYPNVHRSTVYNSQDMECKLVQPLWRTVWRFLKKLEIEPPYDRTGSQLLFDYLSEIHEQKSVILNTNLEFSQWVNVLYDQRMTTALIGRLTHHVELILFPGVNNRLRESSIHETLSRINSQEAGNNGKK